MGLTIRFEPINDQCSPSYKKLVNWFAMQINWLVSIWCGISVVSGLICNQLPWMTIAIITSLTQKGLSPNIVSNIMQNQVN